MDIQDAINIFFAPEPSPPLLVALRARLGNDENSYFFQKQILDYLKISRPTYRKLTGHKLCFLNKMHFQLVGELIINIESSLSLEERLFEELLYYFENIKKV
jgi:hypothetical protein